MAAQENNGNLASGPAVSAGPAIAESPSGTATTAPSEHPSFDTHTSEGRPEMAGSNGSTRGTQRSYGWIWILPAIALAVAILLMSGGAIYWIAANSERGDIILTQGDDSATAVAYQSQSQSQWQVQKQSQTCGTCGNPVRKEVSGGGSSETVVYTSTPEGPCTTCTPQDAGKIEQTVFEWTRQPDSYNEVIENSDQTTAVATPTFNNQTSTTGSYTRDGW